MLPTIRQLTFLIALADYGSFVEAADICAVTQPSLSAGIKELEAILGAQLVERGRKGVKFTPAGAAALIRAREIIRAGNSLKEEVAAAAEPLTGAFRLGIIPTIAPFLSPNAVPKVRKKFEKLKLYLREEQTARLIDGLKNHELDAAIIALPYEAMGIDTLPLFDDEFLYIAPKNYPISPKKFIKIDDVDISNLLLLEDGHCLRDHALSVCGAKSHGHEEVRATSLFTLVQMVAGGLGVSLIPRLAVDAGISLDGVNLRAFDPPLIGRQIGLAWRKGSVRANEAKTLAKILCPQPN